jgi:hypothetical protein
LENLKGRAHSKDLGIGGRIILECILEKYREMVRRCGLDTSYSG